MKKSAVSLEPSTLRARLIAVLTAIILLVVATFGLATLSAFDRAIAPELQNRIRLIGSIRRSEVQRTLDLGIPFEALGGLDAYIRETTIDFSEISEAAAEQATAAAKSQTTQRPMPWVPVSGRSRASRE